MSGAQSLDGALQRAERAAVGSARDYLERLAGLFGNRASVSAVFGEPVQGQGATVIPVARVRFLVGGGLGVGDEVGEGGGGGGGVAATPVGYIEIRDGSATFRPIHRPLGELLRPAAVILTLAIARRARVRARRPAG